MLHTRKSPLRHIFPPFEILPAKPVVGHPSHASSEVSSAILLPFDPPLTYSPLSYAPPPPLAEHLPPMRTHRGGVLRPPHATKLAQGTRGEVDHEPPLIQTSEIVATCAHKYPGGGGRCAFPSAPPLTQPAPPTATPPGLLDWGWIGLPEFTSNPCLRLSSLFI